VLSADKCVQRHVSALHCLRIHQDTHKWDNWFGGPQPTLYLLLDHKKVPLPTGYTVDEYQKIQAFIAQYIALFQRYIGITDVIFDTSHRESESHPPWLWNPIVHDMIVPLPSLKRIQIYTDRYDFHSVEQFMTYALNYLGQRYLKETVEVHIIGPSQRLHPNLRNNLTHFYRTVHVHQQEA
jgi:hypothetical protein